MSIEPERDQVFQYATFAIIGLTVVVCLCYVLVFLNPRANPIAALRPEPPTPILAGFELPATWTPTVTGTLTLTPTSSPTPTSTRTRTRTSVPSQTPLPTNTLIPPPTHVAATQRPPAPRPLPTRTPTRRPTVKPPPPPPTATQPPPPSFILIKNEPHPNCGTWYLQGTIWDHGYGNGFVPGTLVRVWVNGNIYSTDTAGSHNRNNPAYWEVLFQSNQAVGGVVAIVNADSQLLSPQYSFALTASCNGTNGVNEIIMDFSHP